MVHSTLKTTVNRMMISFLVISLLYSMLIDGYYRSYKGSVTRYRESISPTINYEALPKSRSDSSTISDKKKIPLPLMDVSYVGISGGWEKLYENYVLKPKSTTKPRAVVHFLGGAFFGAVPNLSYKFLLETICDEGYIVVATPFRINMNYLTICDEVLEKFDKIAIELANEYGALPVIGLGHSLGSLLQTLITSLFPDTPRAANVLISYNNKIAANSIPLYNELIMPLAGKLSQDFATGKPANDVLQHSRELLLTSFETYAKSQVAPLFMEEEIFPILMQSFEFTDQILPLLSQIAAGQEDFSPSPKDTKDVCRRMYRARKTLLLQFENDKIDETTTIEQVLREANTIMRMKRPMIEMEVLRQTLPGNHLTPLLQLPDRVSDDRSVLYRPLRRLVASLDSERRSMQSLATYIVNFLQHL